MHNLSHSQVPVLFLLTVECFSIFGCKEYNQSDFGVGHQWWPFVESSPVLLEEGVCYDKCVLLAKHYYSLPYFILYSKVKFTYYFMCFLPSSYCIPVPYNENDNF